MDTKPAETVSGRRESVWDTESNKNPAGKRPRDHQPSSQIIAGPVRRRPDVFHRARRARKRSGHSGRLELEECAREHGSGRDEHASGWRVAERAAGAGDGTVRRVLRLSEERVEGVARGRRVDREDHASVAVALRVRLLAVHPDRSRLDFSNVNLGTYAL